MEFLVYFMLFDRGKVFLQRQQVKDSSCVFLCAFKRSWETKSSLQSLHMNSMFFGIQEITGNKYSFGLQETKWTPKKILDLIFFKITLRFSHGRNSLVQRFSVSCGERKTLVAGKRCYLESFPCPASFSKKYNNTYVL